MRKIALLALALTCASAPAFSQEEEGAAPNYADGSEHNRWSSESCQSPWSWSSDAVTS